jgi:hypothetical protein
MLTEWLRSQRDAKWSRSIGWATSTGMRCTVTFCLVFAIPEWFWFAWQFRSEGILSIGSAFAIGAMAVLSGVFVGLLVWFTVMKPLNGALKKVTGQTSSPRA